MARLNFKLLSVPQNNENPTYQRIFFFTGHFHDSLFISLSFILMLNMCCAFFPFDVRLRHLTLHRFLLYEQILTKSIAFTATGTWRRCGP